MIRTLSSPSTRPSAGALNFTNGETVAVKQIQLSAIPKAELGDIMVRYCAQKGLGLSGPQTSADVASLLACAAIARAIVQSEIDLLSTLR